MKARLRISVALATYDGARFLPAQLESLVAQTSLPFELVVTDDASSDETLAVLAAFQARAPFPVHIHVNPIRLGYGANFLRAAALCRGDLVSFCDQDDVWKPTKLAVVHKPFADPSVMAVVHAARVVDAELNDLGWCRPSLPEDGPIAWNPFENHLGFSMVARRSLFEISSEQRPINQPENVPMAHDVWTTFIARAFGTIYGLKEPLALYRQHNRNCFGAGAAPNRGEAPRTPKTPDSEIYRLVASKAATRAEFLGNLIRDPSVRPEQHAALAKYQAIYQRRAEAYGRRARLHASASRLPTRIAALAAMSLSRAYEAENDLSLRSLVKDAASTVLGPRFTRR